MAPTVIQDVWPGIASAIDARKNRTYNQNKTGLAGTPRANASCCFVTLSHSRSPTPTHLVSNQKSIASIDLRPGPTLTQ
ncbi:uncharacterized protein BP01DRAFT_357554 [Aspergillus saccharolyticus JOP 1030-1]|uniref:Uncharacterized protein n=1 Tax=Aspergillus saccharolyticus JOP 1030-1 TaxID=1450539 RepID=A0A318ZB85_9EURO|nr:hypothetical protein BP01DRAFT_357554 [Aspergillus saccharolyticus JOP 1030-1]PYH44569.1 hypothetical protein BP01DRAFT_357554 [Aspergillus saccharolyticus JOP 1030-1]